MTVRESARAMKLAVAICDAASVAVLLLWLIDSGRNPGGCSPTLGIRWSVWRAPATDT